jgi:hypothetical protein
MMPYPSFPSQLVFLTLSFALAACSDAPNLSDSNPGERVGTYDGRAVAIAYAGSYRFKKWMQSFRAKHSRAKEAGDSTEVKALEAMIQRQQDTFHGQAFRGESIDDILALIPDETERIRREVGAVRLEKINAPRPGSVETVDVTDQFVELFRPDEKTRRSVREIRKLPISKSR